MHYAEYMLILSPTGYINEEIKDIKAACADKIGDYKSRYSKAHITIPFDENRQKVFVAEPAIARMETRLKTMAPITLQIKGFDIFPNPVAGTTIYADIDMNEKVKNWFKLLLKEMQLNKRTVKPHLTIARGLTDEQVSILRPFLSRRNFTPSFEVTELIVLKRELFIPEASWQVFKRLPFLNQFSATAQNSNPTLF